MDVAKIKEEEEGKWKSLQAHESICIMNEKYLKGDAKLEKPKSWEETFRFSLILIQSGGWNFPNENQSGFNAYNNYSSRCPHPLHIVSSTQYCSNSGKSWRKTF